MARPPDSTPLPDQRPDAGVPPGNGRRDTFEVNETGRVEFEQMVVKQRPRDAVRPDDREEFLFHRVRSREVPRAQSGNGNDGFADDAFHTFDRFQPAAPKL